MATEKPLFPITLNPSTDLSTSQYLFIKVDSSGEAALAGAGENAAGILQNKPNTTGSELEASIETLGISPIKLGGTVTAGGNIMSDSAGKGVAHTGTNAVLAIALESGVDGEEIACLLVTRTGAGLSSTYSILTIPIALANIADGDVLTTFTPGFAGNIQKISFAVGVPVTTAGDGTTLNIEIGTTNLTGGVVTLTSANCTPLGAVIDGTAITAANSFGDSDTISIEASSTTAFAEGDGYLLIVLSS